MGFTEVLWGFLLLIRISKRHKPRDEECRDGANEHEDEEVAIAQPVAYVSAKHARQHYAEIHDARREGIVCHLMLARCDLLHHEKRQADESESVAEVLQHDTATDEPEAFGLLNGTQSLGDKRKVEHAAEREQ